MTFNIHPIRTKLPDSDKKTGTPVKEVFVIGQATFEISLEDIERLTDTTMCTFRRCYNR